MDCATTWIHRTRAVGGTVGSGRPLERGGCPKLWWRTGASTPMWRGFDVPAPVAGTSGGWRAGRNAREGGGCDVLPAVVGTSFVSGDGQSASGAQEPEGAAAVVANASGWCGGHAGPGSRGPGGLTPAAVTGSPSVGGWGAVAICWGRGEAEIGRSVCVAVVGTSCRRLAAVEGGTPLVEGRSTWTLPAVVGLRWLRLPDALAHPSRPTQAPGAGVDVDIRLARREHLWPCPV
jgi:hypothetical protein